MEKESFFSMKIIIIFAIGVFIGFLGTWISMRDSVPADDTDPVVAETVTGNDVKDIALAGENAILVRDQKAGLVVDVDIVTLENMGWIVVHEDNNGLLGNALGAQLFLAGVNSGRVELLRGMEAGKTYHAVVRQDDGDRAFDLQKDSLLSDGRGDPVQVSFKAIDGESEE